MSRVELRQPGAEELQRVRERIEPYLHRTPLWHSSTLSAMTGLSVYVKAELFQKTGSYKPRGMLNRVMSLPEEKKRQGVITFSSGNAAQGLAYAAKVADVKATVVMPLRASPVKLEATRGYGADVILFGTAQEALNHAIAIAKERDLTFVHPYDDMDLMAGHASVGLEILDELPDASALYVAVGGGGMLGGVALALMGRGSTARLFGAEPAGAPKMFRSLEEGRPVRLDHLDTIADGLAAPSAGESCYPLIRERAEAVILVEDSAITEAMKLLMVRLKLYAEPSGAASVAALLQSAAQIPANSIVVCLISGGNLDPDRAKALLG